MYKLLIRNQLSCSDVVIIVTIIIGVAYTCHIKHTLKGSVRHLPTLRFVTLVMASI